MELCYQILCQEKRVTQRELFYKLLCSSPDYFDSQLQVNRTIQGLLSITTGILDSFYNTFVASDVDSETVA